MGRTGQAGGRVRGRRPAPFTTGRATLAAWLLTAATAGIPAIAEGQPPGPSDVILATTTSVQDSGLLDLLVPAFERATGYQLKPIAVGTGEALGLGRRGEADVLLVHAPAAEQAFLAQGYGATRRQIMHNDFVLVGPAADPAGARGSPSPGEALARIARAGAPFISRGDESGTHKLERTLWEQVRVIPRGRWYIEAGQGMGGVLRLADERDAYTLTDRGTYLALRQGLRLVVLVDGHASLVNPYSVITLSPARFPRVNHPGGQAFAAFLASAQAQAIIREFGRERFGQPLFVPDVIR